MPDQVSLRSDRAPAPVEAKRAKYLVVMSARFLLTSVASVAILLAGCTTGGSDDGSEAAIVVPTPASEGEVVPTRTVVGEPIGFLYRLSPGDCFNDYGSRRDESGVRREMTTIVDCSIPHDAEVYAELTHPAEAGVSYPGAVELNRWGTAECYSTFAEFVGVEYELSGLEIGVVIPEEPNWLAGPYRTFECYVYSIAGQLSGSMRASGL